LFDNDKRYIGEWKKGIMHGYGEYTWEDGKKYKGIYKNDKKEGFGIFYWPDINKIYVGYWKEGKQDGVGMIVNKNNNKYGIWNEGRKTITFKNYWEIKKTKKLDNLHLKFFQMSFDSLVDFVNCN